MTTCHTISPKTIKNLYVFHVVKGFLMNYRSIWVVRDWVWIFPSIMFNLPKTNYGIKSGGKKKKKNFDSPPIFLPFPSLPPHFSPLPFALFSPIVWSMLLHCAISICHVDFLAAIQIYCSNTFYECLEVWNSRSLNTLTGLNCRFIRRGKTERSLGKFLLKILLKHRSLSTRKNPWSVFRCSFSEKHR